MLYKFRIPVISHFGGKPLTTFAYLQRKYSIFLARTLCTAYPWCILPSKWWFLQLSQKVAKTQPTHHFNHKLSLPFITCCPITANQTRIVAIKIPQITSLSGTWGALAAALLLARPPSSHWALPAQNSAEWRQRPGNVPRYYWTADRELQGTAGLNSKEQKEMEAFSMNKLDIF